MNGNYLKQHSKNHNNPVNFRDHYNSLSLLEEEVQKEIQELENLHENFQNHYRSSKSINTNPNNSITSTSISLPITKSKIDKTNIYSNTKSSKAYMNLDQNKENIEYNNVSKILVDNCIKSYYSNGNHDLPQEFSNPINQSWNYWTDIELSTQNKSPNLMSKEYLQTNDNLINISENPIKINYMLKFDAINHNKSPTLMNKITNSRSNKLLKNHPKATNNQIKNMNANSRDDIYTGKEKSTPFKSKLHKSKPRQKETISIKNTNSMINYNSTPTKFESSSPFNHKILHGNKGLNLIPTNKIKQNTCLSKSVLGHETQNDLGCVCNPSQINSGHDLSNFLNNFLDSCENQSNLVRSNTKCAHSIDYQNQYQFYLPQHVEPENQVLNHMNIKQQQHIDHEDPKKLIIDTPFYTKHKKNSKDFRYSTEENDIFKTPANHHRHDYEHYDDLISQGPTLNSISNIPNNLYTEVVQNSIVNFDIQNTNSASTSTSGALIHSKGKSVAVSCNPLKRDLSSKSLTKSRDISPGLRNQINHEFRPQLSKKSLCIASKMGDAFNRLVNKHKFHNPEKKKKLIKDIESDLTFKPQINKKSQKLDANFRAKVFNGDELHRWDQLLLLHNKSELEKQMKKLELEKKELENESQYNHTPTLCKASYDINREYNGDIVKRFYNWQKHKEDKINKERKLYSEREFDNCTFKPFSDKDDANLRKSISSQSRSINSGRETHIKVKGLENHLERVEKAKRIKKEKEALNNRVPGCNWEYKITMPQEFKFHSEKPYSNISESPKSKITKNIVYFPTVRNKSLNCLYASSNKTQQDNSFNINEFNQAMNNLHSELHRMSFCDFDTKEKIQNESYICQNPYCYQFVNNFLQ